MAVRGGTRLVSSPASSSSPRCVAQRASRRSFLHKGSVLLASVAVVSQDRGMGARAEAENASRIEIPALKGKDYGKEETRYPDYILSASGIQYKDLREGGGSSPDEGNTVVVDWAGYTIGYYGRIFETRNRSKGGSFTGEEKDFFRFKLNSETVIPAFREAVSSMKVGGVRRVVVPPGAMGYPEGDWKKADPKPSTFSGYRSLDFVLKNEGLIDKTLLFDIELIAIK